MESIELDFFCIGIGLYGFSKDLSLNQWNWIIVIAWINGTELLFIKELMQLNCCMDHLKDYWTECCAYLFVWLAHTKQLQSTQTCTWFIKQQIHVHNAEYKGSYTVGIQSTYITTERN